MIQGDDGNDSDAEFEALLEQQSRMEETAEKEKMARKVARKTAQAVKEADAKANKVGNVKTRMVNSEAKADQEFEVNLFVQRILNHLISRLTV